MPHTQSIVVKQKFLFQFLLLYWIKHIEGISTQIHLTISVPPIQCDINYTYGLHTVFFLSLYFMQSISWKLVWIVPFFFNAYEIFCLTVYACNPMPFELNELIVVFFIWFLFRFFFLLMLIALVKIGKL